jgi:hypothetical protein
MVTKAPTIPGVRVVSAGVADKGQHLWRDVTPLGNKTDNAPPRGGTYVLPEKVPTWPEAMSLAEGRCFHT